MSDFSADMKMPSTGSHQESITVDNHAAAHLGAVLEEEERKLNMRQTVKLHWRPLLCCSVAFTSSMLFGYDSIANGASLAMPSFFIYFGDFGPEGPYLPSIWTSLWSAMSQLAQAIGAFAVGFLMDRFGRKYVGCVASALTLVGTAVQFVSHDRATLLGGKIINGVGIGAAFAIGFTYASEVAPLKLRAPLQQGIILSMVFMFALALGIVRIFVPDVRPSAFRTVLALQWVVGAIATVAWAVVPESPSYLLQKGRIESAQKAMKKIYGNNRSVEHRVAFIAKTIREEESHQDLNSGSYLDCFRADDLKRTLTVLFIYTAISWGGSAFLTQNILVLIIAGLPAIHAFDIGIGGFALALLIIVGSWAIIGRFKRHNAFIFGCIINLVFMTVIGALHYVPGTSGLWAAAVLMNLVITFQTSLIQAMGYPIAAEISSYRLRAKTLSLAAISQAIVSWITAFVVPYMYNVDSGNLGLRTAFVWAGFSVLLIIGAWYLLPDTTNLTMEEIDKLYATKTNPRHFQKALNQGKIETEARRGSVEA